MFLVFAVKSLWYMKRFSGAPKFRKKITECIVKLSFYVFSEMMLLAVTVYA